jgi:hypothetical protein
MRKEIIFLPMPICDNSEHPVLFFSCVDNFWVDLKESESLNKVQLIVFIVHTRLELEITTVTQGVSSK